MYKWYKNLSRYDEDGVEPWRRKLQIYAQATVTILRNMDAFFLDGGVREEDKYQSQRFFT
jgi:hypothetical protein